MFVAFSARATDERRPAASATRATAAAISAPRQNRKRDRLKRAGTNHTMGRRI
jgi:hypothetical protein